MRVISFDHVALWVGDPTAVARVLLDVCDGLREIERTDAFVLLGADAREGKLTLFEAEPERAPGALAEIVVRVPDVDAGLARADRLGLPRDGSAFLGPEGLVVRLVAGATDLDGVVLAVSDTAAVSDTLRRLGFAQDGDRLSLAGRFVTLRQAATEPTGRPLLNHLALRVASLDEAREEIRAGGWPIDREVDAENTRAVFVRAPEGIVVELVEHKPSFSLV